MTPLTRSSIAVGLATLSLLLLAVAAVVEFGTGDPSVNEEALIVPAIAADAVVGAIIARRHPRNSIGWLFLAIGLAGSMTLFAASWASSEGQTGAEWAALVATLGLGGLLGLPFVLLLFPTGRLLSARWRWAFWLTVAAAATIEIGSLLSPTFTDYPDLENPIGLEALRGTPLFQGGVGWVLVVASILVSAACPILRYRRAEGDEREQLKWLALSAGVIGFGWILLSTSYSESGVQTLATRFLRVPFYVGLLSLPIAVGIAILKYRLYEIDLVIRKTVVFAILVALLMGIGGLAAVAIGGPLVDHASDRPELILLAGLALGLLAVPLYRLATRVADRLVFRGRASPYEVLRTFAGRVGETYSNEDVLPRMARVLGEATGASRSRVWVRVGDELRVGASWPDTHGQADPAALVGGAPPAHLDEHAAEVRHLGELLGALSVSMPPNDPMTPSKETLVRDVASQAGLVLRNVRLIEELRESRRRIVAAQDERAKKLERDIHDGAQQQLVALTVKQRLAATLVGKDDERLLAMLNELQHETNAAVENLRDLARGIYPPLLADKGLPAALDAQARKAAVPVVLEADGIGRFPQEIEGAVYFSVLEAVQNAAKYAEAAKVEVTLSAADGVLEFGVADDGCGFDVAAAGGGTGLQGMADRVEAVGGTLLVESSRGLGTRVTGNVPIAELPLGAP